MNNRLLVPRKTPGLLDLVPGAAAAYSLRSLSRSYAGPVVTVRRSSDNAEDSFTAAEVADGTLAAFCGAGDGFVKTWHSQTGSNDATQTTAGYQPKIVSSGVLILEEGKPAIQFDGIDDSLDANALAPTFSGIDKPISVASAFNCDTGTGGLFVFSFGNSASIAQMILLRSLGGRVDFYARDNASQFNNLVGGNSLSQSVVFAYSNMDTIVLRQNGAGIGTSTSSLGDATLNIFSIGCQTRISKSNFFSGTMQELIIYPANITAQTELVEGLIAWGYSV